MEAPHSSDEQSGVVQVATKHHFRIQNQWKSTHFVPAAPPTSIHLQPVEECSGVGDEVDGTVLRHTRLGHHDDGEHVEEITSRGARQNWPPVDSFRKFRSLDFQVRFQNVFKTACAKIHSPLPQFNWAESSDVWKNMQAKDERFLRDPAVFSKHAELQPRMRSILLEWLSEVCEVYRLHKETYTLAMDYIDRYLSVTQDVPKTQLQLLGISALFLAAKFEEIYPPKLSDFAYVTDSACTEAEITKQELIIIKALKWELTPMTTNSWLCVYLQVANLENIHDPALGFVFPQFSTHSFIQISRLCDLALLDSGSLKFRYGLIAAAALYHHTTEEVVHKVSGLNWADLYPCVRWMVPFARASLNKGPSPVKFFSQVANEDAHNIQTHNVDMALLDCALSHQEELAEQERQAPNFHPDLSSQLACLLEPPESHSTYTSLGEEQPQHAYQHQLQQHSSDDDTDNSFDHQHHQHHAAALSHLPNDSQAYTANSDCSEDEEMVSELGLCS